MSFENCWLKICKNEGKNFLTKTKLDFTYVIKNNNIIPSRTKWNIPKTDIEKAYNMLPVDGPGEFNNTVMGPSYIWGILSDERIIEPLSKKRLKIDMLVEIVTKKDQSTGKLTRGTIKRILTSTESHPYGIKVELDSGQIGRVKKIIKIEQKQKLQIKSKSIGFIDLDKKEIPKVEDVNNEFKEFYNYDLKMESFKNGPKNMEAIANLKKSAIQNVVKAICSFGNSDGGFVYIGIKHDGTISGLEKDLEFGKFKDYNDSFANNIRDHLISLIEDRIFLARKMKIKFCKIEHKMICLIQILPSNKPLYLNTSKGKFFFIRGATPRAEHLDADDLYRYIKDRFPEYG